MALIVAHKRAKAVDKETVHQLEAKLKSERSSCGETSLFFAGMFLFHSNRPDKAREYIDRMLKMSPQSKEVRIHNALEVFSIEYSKISKYGRGLVC